jgi:predicted nucleic acid-binding protein
VILVDTSVWVEHLRVGEAMLAALLEAGQVLVHPFVIGELALGSLRQRAPVLALLQDMPAAVVATDREVMQFIERYSLAGQGIGYVDAHLLASVRLTAGSSIWTLDRRLAAVATRQGMTSALRQAGFEA